MEIEIRRAVPGDAQLVCDLSTVTFIETYRESCPDDDLLDFIDTCFNEDAIARELEDPADLYYLAFAEGLPAGYMRLKKDSSSPLQQQNSIELKRIYVLADHQAKHIGSALLQYAFDMAAPAYDIMVLGVWDNNARAIAFYLRHGFEDINHPHTFYVGNTAQTDRWMARLLKKST